MVCYVDVRAWGKKQKIKKLGREKKKKNGGIFLIVRALYRDGEVLVMRGGGYAGFLLLGCG